MLNQIVADSGTATESRTLRFGITAHFDWRGHGDLVVPER
jgi:hypothetical protein